MENRFHHENLTVYQRAITFVAHSHSVVEAVSARAAVKDQLKRAGESIPVNIAGSNAQRSPEEQRRLIEIAMGSTAECAACLDVLRAKDLCDDEPFDLGKKLLIEIYSMLSGLRQAKENRIREDGTPYGGCRFSHEQLDVYRVALESVRIADRLVRALDVGAAGKEQIDRYTTSIVLNIAEGNAKRTARDRGKYFDTAMSAALRAASVLDVFVARGIAVAAEIDEMKVLLARATAMLLGMQKRIRDHG